MDDSVVRGFFAYPSVPPTIPELIRSAANRINGQTPNIHIRLWEELRVTGKVIIREVCDAIDSAHLLLADVTGVNPNVMFELGYAIARGKRIWVVLDTTLATAKRDYEQLQLLTGVGYVPYANSDEIVRAFSKDHPFTDLDRTLYDSAIEPFLTSNRPVSLLYLKGKHRTEPERRLGELVARFQREGLPAVVDDPNEARIQPLAWYAEKTNSAIGVLVHLLGPKREGWALHNARYAFVSGLAHGFEKPLLMLAEADYDPPLDYQHLLTRYQTARECVEQATRFLEHTLHGFTASQAVPSLRLDATEPVDLRRLYLGELAAENERDTLDAYFVETAEYQEALRGRFNLFVGRKGAGKTANLLCIASELSRDTRNLVVVVKPIDYDLEGVVRLLRKYRERDTKGYMVESLWKYLIYTEIARATIELIERRKPASWRTDEQELIELAEGQASSLRADFSIRLERCVENLLALQPYDRLEATRLAISESLHSGLLRELRVLLGKVLHSRHRVAVLVDNLDKNWTRNGDLSELSELLLGLLTAARRIPVEFVKEGPLREPVNLTLTAFIRSDIFQQVLRVAREPDKILYSRMTWDDHELLLRVLEKRLVTTHDRGNEDGIWTRVFTRTVKGTPTRDFLLDHVLKRPRDVIFLGKAAIAVAANRGHNRVEETDLSEAQKQYSQFVLDTTAVEGEAAIPETEAILYEFAGADEILSQSEIEGTLVKAGVAHERCQTAIENLLALSFLGIEVQDDTYAFATDEDDMRKQAVLSRKLNEARGYPPRYRVHKAFHAFLEVSAAEGAT